MNYIGSLNKNWAREVK